jgi:hypothetical protein
MLTSGSNRKWQLCTIKKKKSIWQLCQYVKRLDRVTFSMSGPSLGFYQLPTDFFFLFNFILPA